MRKKFLLTVAILAVSLFSACNMTEEQIDQALDMVEDSLNKEQNSDKEDASGVDGTKEDVTDKDDEKKENEEVNTPEATTAPTSTPVPTSTLEPTSTPTPTPTPMPVLVYETGDTGVVITGVNDTSITKLEIPDAIDGLPVVGIAYRAFAECANLESIVVDANNAALTSRASDGTECNAIISIADNKMVLGCKNTTIPENVKTIGPYAFTRSGITKLVIPATVEQIEDTAFVNCASLQEIVVEGNTAVKKSAFYGCDLLSKLTLSAEMVEAGWKNAFPAEKITSITLLEGIKKLTADMFSDCKFQEINIPSSVILIDENAFTGTPLEYVTVSADNQFYTTKAEDGTECNAVIDIQYKSIVVGTANSIIPSEVTGIGNNAFYGRTVKELVLPDTITVGKNCFSHVEKITVAYDLWEAVVTKNVKKYLKDLVITGDSDKEGFDYFDYDSYPLETIVLPKNLKQISSGAFRGCKELRHVELPEGLEKINENAFSGCTSLAEIKIPSTVKVIERNAFADSGLTSVSLPEGLTGIGDNAFDGCEMLTSVVLPGSSLTDIGRHIFYRCANLEEVVLGEGLPHISPAMFLDCTSLASIELPESATVIFDRAFDGCTNLKNVRLSEKTEAIMEDAFRNCTSLEEIYLPSGLNAEEKRYIFKMFNYASEAHYKGLQNVFTDCTNLTFIYAEAGSYAAEWAKEQGYRVMEPQE